MALKSSRRPVAFRSETFSTCINLCKRVAALPRELVDRVLVQLDNATLLAIKYAKGLRGPAFDLAHQRLWLTANEDDDHPERQAELRQRHIQVVQCLGRVLRNLTYQGRFVDYRSLADLLQPTALPVLRYFKLFNDANEALHFDHGHAQYLIEQVGRLPQLTDLSIRDGRQSAMLQYEWALGFVNVLRSVSKLWVKDRAALFPSLRTLSLNRPGPVLLACLFSKEYKLPKLERLELRNLSEDVQLQLETFPSGLRALSLNGCQGVDWTKLRRLVRGSRTTLRYLSFRILQEACTDFEAKKVKLPSLRCISMAFDTDDDDDEEPTSVWSRQMIQFLSKLRAPEVEILALTKFLDETPEDALQKLAKAARRFPMAKLWTSGSGHLPGHVGGLPIERYIPLAYNGMLSAAFRA